MNKKSYFGIIAIATTMLGAMALSSCSHDDYYYSEEKAELSVNEKYAVAFEKALRKRLARLAPMSTGASAARTSVHEPLPVLREIV